MDLQARKLSVIEYVIGLNDDKILSELEAAVFRNQRADKLFRPLTRKELISRAKKSEEDFLNGRVISQEALEAESDNW